MEQRLSRRAGIGAVFGLGALACVGCCAAPLLIALGVSAGASTAIAMWTERVAQIAFASALVLGGAVWLLRRRAKAQAAADCGDACAVDRSCGCASANSASGCTLPREDAKDRLDAFRELFAGGLHRTERRPGSVAFVFTDNELTASRVNALIEAESRCCSFLRFDVRREGGELRWTTSADVDHAEVLETWADLPALSQSADGTATAIDRLGLRERTVAA